MNMVYTRRNKSMRHSIDAGASSITVDVAPRDDQCLLISYDCLTMPWNGVRTVPYEMGVKIHGMNADQMREILGSHPTFKN